MRIFIASDHAGFELKQTLLKKFPELNMYDLGPSSTDSVDYPDYADKVAHKVAEGGTFGILICGTGQGMVIRANRYHKVRAALCWNKEIATFARSHNDANVLCLPARMISADESVQIMKTFFATEFEGGRHINRVHKLEKPC